MKDCLMMKQKIALSVAVLSAGLVMNVARAEDNKLILFVDMQKALQNVSAGKKAKTQLETEFNAKKKELQTEENSIRKATEEFKKQSLVLNDEARAKKQGELQERIMKFQELTARSQAAIQQKEKDLTQPIITRLQALSEDVKKKHKAKAVFVKNENVLASDPEDDVTDEVIALYEKAK